MAEPAEEPKPKSGRTRTLLLVAALVVGEAALILGVMALFSGPPEVEASALAVAEVPEDEKIVEQQVLSARLPNSKRGLTYLYETEIYVQVRRRHLERVATELEQFRYEIKAELTTVWRTSDPHDFDEPGFETLMRKVHALMNQRFGVDPQTNEPVVQKVVIVMGTGMRVDA
jgi:hypothetical protein